MTIHANLANEFLLFYSSNLTNQTEDTHPILTIFSTLKFVEYLVSFCFEFPEGRK